MSIRPKNIKTEKQKNLFIILFFGFLVFWFFGLSIAQEEAVEQPISEEQEEGRISLDLQGVDINELFKMISLKSELTIIATPAVQGRITVFLNNLTYKDALDVIITTQNLGYEKQGNIIKIMTAAEYEQIFGKKVTEKKEVKTIKLQYAKPSEILVLITSLKSSIGEIVVDDASGTILINDSPQAIALIEKTIAELDQPLETAVFDINYANPEDIKTHISDLVTPGVGRVITDTRSSKAIVTDLPQRLAKIASLIKELDEESRQVLITGEIIEIVLKEELTRGIEWEKVFGAGVSDGLDLAGEFPATFTDSYANISIGTIANNKYTAVINLLSEFGDTKTLSRPRVVVVNKEEAEVLVGTREAYITQTLSQAESTTVTAESIEFIDVGIKLNVVPTIGKDGYITMKIKPEVSSVSETLTTSGGSEIPIVATSETETVVKVKDGSTIMIAGLLKEKKSDTIKGLPFLSRLPVIGLLFGSRNIENPEKTELVIFLTPQIITGEGRLVREINDE
ncbi:MAG: hypothetical protein KJ793_00875 [Candidatus Omnitrophica bacterium]|nr:hypothetical protein [Candidatus Omnitrophota bacterium]